MAARSVSERVDILEQKVGELQLLPARLDALESQILQLRGDGIVPFAWTVVDDHTAVLSVDSKSIGLR